MDNLEPASKRRRVDSSPTHVPTQGVNIAPQNPAEGKATAASPSSSTQLPKPSFERLAQLRRNPSTSLSKPFKSPLKSSHPTDPTSSHPPFPGPVFGATIQQIKTLQSEIHTLSTALEHVRSPSRDQRLEELTKKWRLVTRDAAEAVFEVMKERVDAMGGLGAWRREEAAKKKEFGEMWGGDLQKSSARAVEDKGGVRAGAEGEEVAAQVEDWVNGGSGDLKHDGSSNDHEGNQDDDDNVRASCLPLSLFSRGILS